MRPAPWLSGILAVRKSEDSIMMTPPQYFAVHQRERQRIAISHYRLLLVERPFASEGKSNLMEAATVMERFS
jgi:hypothetical protein